MVTEELAVIDNLSGKLYLIVYADPTQPEAYSKARQRLKDLRIMLRRGVDAPVTSASVRTEAIREFAKEDYLKAVEGPGIRDGRRSDAGADRPAHPQAVCGFAADTVPRAAFAESVAVYVLLQFRRHADRRRIAGNSGA
jgi:hypothetical protein